MSPNNKDLKDMKDKVIAIYVFLDDILKESMHKNLSIEMLLIPRLLQRLLLLLIIFMVILIMLLPL